MPDYDANVDAIQGDSVFVFTGEAEQNYQRHTQRAAIYLFLKKRLIPRIK